MTTNDSVIGLSGFPNAAVSRSTAFGREVVILGLAFVAMLFVVSSVIWGIAGIDPIESAFGKMIGIGGDTILAILITLALWRIRAWSLGNKALVACLLSLAAAPASGMLDWAIQIFFVWPKQVPFNPQYFAQVVVFTTSELFGWSCLYLALQYNSQMRESERRLAAVREEALSAQMRALQYQINPHFLFNTLNSVAGLMEEGSTEPARDMVLRLANFLRRTLALDPMTDVRLDEEIALQLEYLGIEEARFSDRMDVRLDVDPSVHIAKVPGLILQPLVENAVKHGVARTPGSAILIIGACRGADRSLRLWVENSVPPGEPPPLDGMGIGLSNVASRLTARYGKVAECVSVATHTGSSRVEIRMPLVL
jgi:two-component system LytT family sensor kinase